MRNKLVAGNWKMNKDIRETEALIGGLKERLRDFHGPLTAVLCPPFPSLVVAAALLKGTPFKLGAQNMSHLDEGAYTGEVAARMLLAAGCEYVILGHSERRQYFKEADELINQKLRKALSVGLTPIVCVGETLDERNAGITENVISAQISGVLKDLSGGDVGKTVIAYEPVWAIGTGLNATPEQADQVHAFIRKLTGRLYSWADADRLIILYGGSLNPQNALELLRQPNIDGGLVGGASLKADAFAAIIQAGVEAG